MVDVAVVLEDSEEPGRTFVVIVPVDEATWSDPDDALGAWKGWVETAAAEVAATPHDGIPYERLLVLDVRREGRRVHHHVAVSVDGEIALARVDAVDRTDAILAAATGDMLPFVRSSWGDPGHRGRFAVPVADVPDDPFLVGEWDSKVEKPCLVVDRVAEPRNAITMRTDPEGPPPAPDAPGIDGGRTFG